MKDLSEKEYAELYRRSVKFHDQLTNWMKEDGVYPELPSMEGYDRELMNKYSAEFNLAQVITIKKRISSTHIWINGKTRYSKKLDNWYSMSIECQVCKMGASRYHEIGPHRLDYVDVNLVEKDIPSRDMHGQLIRRTCAEVLEAKMLHRKLHKGGKCLQCNTYECEMKGV